ncbi:MAG: PKD domain-containing protein [Bacteroidales bacterium]
MKTTISTYRWGPFRVLLLLLMIQAATMVHGADLKFVAVVYDQATFIPVSGKQVLFRIERIIPAQTVYQVTAITNASGEVIAPVITLADSVWYRYTYSVLDCQNNLIAFSDSLQVNGNDTLFSFLGICHSTVPGTCNANFIFQQDTANPFLIHFQNTSTGSYNQVSWSFGDGTTSNLQNPLKQYFSPGVYLVCLTVTDTGSFCQHSWCNVVSITQGVIIQTQFVHQIDSFAVTPRKVNFTDQTVSNIPVNHYLWTFGDGSMAAIPNPVHQYQQSGTFQVCLRSGLAGGVHDTVCHMVSVPGYFNLWGQVFAGNSTIGSGKVQLINPKVTPKGYPVLDEIQLTGIGLYFFAQRITHSYLLRSFPEYGNPQFADYLPTYSGNVVFWKEASRIELLADTGNTDIALVKKMPLLTGPCTVGGVVVSNAGPAGFPGALVLLLNPDNDNILAFTFADTAGNWYLDQLPYGSYTLVAEVPGLDATPVPVELSPLNPNFTNVMLPLSGTTGINEGVKLQTLSCYPNPASREITIAFPHSSNPEELLIYNASGINVLRKRLVSATHDHQTLDISSLANGFYTVKIRALNMSWTARFLKVE